MRVTVKSLIVGGMLALANMPASAMAQMKTVDPNAAMQRDLAPVPSSEATYGTGVSDDMTVTTDATRRTTPATGDSVTSNVPRAAAQGQTYQKDDLLSAAEGTFGKGAKGLAKLLEKILHDQGEPNAYISGREAGAAFIAGLRYGSGEMHHKVEGDRAVYWTGPSLGFDFGGNGAKTFVLVYNLYDSQDLYRRYPAVEGTAYVIGGFTASYLRRGDIVLIPIRLGVGWRLGVNLGYMKFSEKSEAMPF